MRQARQHARSGSQTRRQQEQRRRLALEAARLMSESGIRDYQLAKRKAAERLGVRDDKALPRNSEIEDALREYQRLFLADSQPRLLQERREAAEQAMAFFERFEPRLVGAVLEGTADAHSAVCLHLFSDDPESVPLFLREQRIPYEQRSRQLRLDRQRSTEAAVYVFSAAGTPIDITVLPRDALRQAPLDRVAERPMQRASISGLRDLLLAGRMPACPQGGGA
jgi:hypothetical protein